MPWVSQVPTDSVLGCGTGLTALGFCRASGLTCGFPKRNNDGEQEHAVVVNNTIEYFKSLRSSVQKGRIESGKTRFLPAGSMTVQS
jgi:hypothetical protein